MRIYWYWPFARSEELGLAPAVTTVDDRLLIHTLDRVSAPTSETHATWRTERVLPDVEERMAGRAQWAISRTATYVGRIQVRRSAIRAFVPDLIHIKFLNYFTDPVDLPLIARKRRLVCSVHDVVPHTRRMPAGVERTLLTRLYRTSGHLVVHHDHIKERLVGEFGVDTAHIHVIPLQVPEFGPWARVDPPSDPRVLFFGTFRQNKGIPILLEAISELPDRNLRFHFAGQAADGQEDLVLRAAERDSRITTEVGWISPERKSELYAAARLVVLPYTAFASQSGVLHDAYGHGRPVVVTDTGALGHTVREDGTGWVVAPGDVEQLAGAISLAMTQPSDYGTAADAARRIARSRSAAEVGWQLRRLYAHLA